MTDAYDRTDRPTTERRRLLSLFGSGVLGTVAGCSGTDTEPTGSSADSSPPASPETQPTSTPRDGASPNLFDLDLSYITPDGGDRGAVTVVGVASDPSGVATVAASLDGSERQQEGNGAEEFPFELSLPVPGGDRYTLTVRATDTRGNEQTESLDTRYVAAPSEEVASDRLVGVHYYGWWGRGGHWDGGYRGTPTLGEYDSRDPGVIDQHLSWLQNFGINWLNLSWWGRDSWSDGTFQNHLLPSDSLGDTAVSVLYESTKMLTQDPGWNVDFGAHGNREQFLSDVEYLAETYFSHPNYLRVDGDPVLYLYVAGGFLGDFAGAVAEAEARTGVDLYLVGDLPFEPWVPANADHLRTFDAVSNYTAFYEAVDGVDDRVPDYPLSRYTEWKLASAAADVAFVPGVCPGFDKTENDSAGAADLPILHRSPERFREWCTQTVPFLDPALNAVLITSFNENHEYTQIEPCEPYGKAYLDVVDETLATGDGRYLNLDTYAAVDFEFDRTVSEHDLHADEDPRFSRELAMMVRSIRLTNGESGWERDLQLEPRDQQPYFPEGIFAHNPNVDARWFGGVTGRARLALDRSVLSKATELHVEARSVPDDPGVTATVVVDGVEAGRLEVAAGPFQQFTVPLTG